MTKQLLLLSSVLAVSALASSASTASADTKSWTALKGHVPANAEILVGFDVKAARSASSYAKVVEAIATQSRDIGTAMALIKSSCSIDLSTMVSDVTLSIHTKGPDEVMVALGLDGVDEAKLVDCANKVSQVTSKGAKVTSKPGKVSEYTITEGKETHTIYAAWPAKDVVVFSSSADDRSKLDAYLNGKAAAGDLGTFLGKATTSGTIAWVAAVVGEDHVKGAYGSATLAKGTVTGTMHVVADTATDAAKMLKDATTELQSAQTHMSKFPELVKVLKAVKLATSGADVTVDGSLSEADLPAILPALGKL